MGLKPSVMLVKSIAGGFVLDKNGWITKNKIGGSYVFQFVESVGLKKLRSNLSL